MVQDIRGTVLLVPRTIETNDQALTSAHRSGVACNLSQIAVELYYEAMRAWLPMLALCVAAQAHDVITTAITWDREISRLVYTHCASCHHAGGVAFSLMTYKEARPWAEAIKEEVIARR